MNSFYYRKPPVAASVCNSVNSLKELLHPFFSNLNQVTEMNLFSIRKIFFHYKIIQSLWKISWLLIAISYEQTEKNMFQKQCINKNAPLESLFLIIITLASPKTFEKRNEWQSFLLKISENAAEQLPFRTPLNTW